MAALALLGCLDPNASKQELIRAGNEHFWRGQYVQAIGPFKTALEQYNASDPDVLFKIGQCYSFMKDYREAIYYYDRALASFPGHEGAARALAEAQAKLAESARSTSASELNGGGAMTPRLRAQRLMEVARTYEAGGDLDRALANYQRAADVADHWAYTHAELGRFYMRTGRNEQAIAQLQHAHTLNPNEPGVADDLAKLGAN